MKNRSNRTSHLREALALLMASSLALVSGCGEKTAIDCKDRDGKVIGKADKNNKCPALDPPTPSACPGLDYVADCAADATRVEFTVVDEDGKPVSGVLVDADAQHSSDARRTAVNFDPVKFPAKNGPGNFRQYVLCTNDAGKASMCAFNPAKLPIKQTYNYVFGKSEYLVATAPAQDITAGSVTVVPTVTLKKNPNATTEKLFVVPGVETDLYMATLDLKFTFGSRGTMLDTLIPDAANPLGQYDTIVFNYENVLTEFIEEFLVPANRDRLLAWVDAGGLLIMLSQNDKTFTKLSNPACSDSLPGCPGDLFPGQYHFEWVFEKDHCNDYTTISVLAPDSPLYSGLADLTTTTYLPHRMIMDVGHLMIPDSIDRATVNETVWTVLSAGPSDAAEISSKNTGCGPAYAVAKGAVKDMEAVYGKGKFMVLNSDGAIWAALNDYTIPDALRTTADSPDSAVYNANLRDIIRAWKPAATSR